MGIIKAFIDKYEGDYLEGIERTGHSTIGNFSSQPKSGKLIYKGNKIKVAINEVGGANTFSELFRMKLFLDSGFDSELMIFPRSYWSRKLRGLFQKKDKSLLNTVKQQYKLRGDKVLINKLLKSEKLFKCIVNEYDCITYSKKHPNILIITPAHGYRSVQHLEKLAETLVVVKEIMGNLHLNNIKDLKMTEFQGTNND